MNANPPRWHADPTRRHELRYWDGRAWTAHVSDRGIAGTDPLPGADRTSEATLMPTSEGRSTPADHEPMSAGPSMPRQAPEARPARPARSAERGRRSRPSPIVTRAGWSRRTKLLVGFLAIDAIVAVILIVLLAR